MSLPVIEIKMPADLVGATNGKLTTQLVPVAFPGRNGRLHSLAAQAWLALAQGCLEATGITLTVTSTADAYRSYDQQRSAFISRYTTAYRSGAPTRHWNGVTWYLKAGMAQVSTPGNSNHGLGLAVDMCEWLEGRIEYIGGSPAWGWLQAHVTDYGFSWETQSEVWHIRYVLGDVEIPQPNPIPVPVYDYEPYPHITKPLLTIGANGDVVAYLQRVLAERLGYQIAVDGQFGRQTQDFVTWYQAVNGLVADGRVGRITWASIDALALA